ncbi:MAG: hypothetical protein ABFR75_04710 [Acidobacteriota bacterium]
MDKRKDMFSNYSSGEKLGDNFEDKVFSKIKRKKRQRKTVVSTMGVFLLGGILFVTNGLFFNGTDNNRGKFGNKYAGRQEVPLTDDVIFSSSDERNSYIIEHVGNFEESQSI